MLLGLDPSTTRFGFAFGDEAARAPKSGVWRLPGADDFVFDDTLARAAESVSSLCRLIKATHCIIEAPIITTDRSPHTMVALMQLTGAVRAAARRAGCRLYLPARSTVLKHFVGHGRPENPKRAVLARCELLGWEASDDNAGDACACWSFGLKHFFERPLDICVTPLFREKAA